MTGWIAAFRREVRDVVSGFAFKGTLVLFLLIALFAGSLLSRQSQFDGSGMLALLLLSGPLALALSVGVDAVPRDQEDRLWSLLAITPPGVRGHAIIKGMVALSVPGAIAVSWLAGVWVAGLVPAGVLVALIRVLVPATLLFAAAGFLLGSLVFHRAPSVGAAAGAVVFSILTIEPVFGWLWRPLGLTWITARSPTSALHTMTDAALRGYGTSLPFWALAAALVLYAAGVLRVERRGVVR